MTNIHDLRLLPEPMDFGGQWLFSVLRMEFQDKNGIWDARGAQLYVDRLTRSYPQPGICLIVEVRHHPYYKHLRDKRYHEEYSLTIRSAQLPMVIYSSL